MTNRDTIPTRALRRWLPAALLVAVLIPPCQAQRGPGLQRDPHIGFLYPAGGKRGTTFEVTVGGQYLEGVKGVYVPVPGLEVTVADYKRPPRPGELTQMREKMEKARDAMQEEFKAGGFRGMRGGQAAMFGTLKEKAKEQGMTEEELLRFLDFTKKRRDPKRQENPALEESVTLKVTLAEDAPLGTTELRVRTGQGLSNPLAFQISTWSEVLETEPNDEKAAAKPHSGLPMVLNGQIMPGDVDRFSFHAEQGTRLVVAASARELVPALADAVPGWFQATLALYDAKGREMVYADDYQFSPDPVLYAEIPETGVYSVEIKDAIYRGREDFVYRIAVGEIPFVTTLFPLGGCAGAQTNVTLEGWNLPIKDASFRLPKRPPGVHPVAILAGQPTAKRVSFAISNLQEVNESEPNDEPVKAQSVQPPLIVNGRIDRSGDLDVFAFECRGGGQIAAEITARRLASPLDSVLKITDESGKQLALNDDFEDPAAALVTHHADSRLQITIPKSGRYYVHVGDRLNKGAAGFSYRLELKRRRPDFELRVVPSSVNAKPGTSVPITVYALRKDGFDGEISLELGGAPAGCSLSGGWIPAGQDQIRMTLTAPREPRKDPVALQLKGTASIQGRTVTREAVPAEDMMQAFIYHHLIPAEAWLFTIAESGRRRPPSIARYSQEPLRLAPGKGAAAEFTAPPQFGFVLNNLEFELSEPPKGISLGDATFNRGRLRLPIAADAEKIEPGLEGNLIINTFVQFKPRQRPPAASSDGESPAAPTPAPAPAATRRILIGCLPAVPFRVTSGGSRN